MALPSTANWGSADKKTPRPAAPNRGDIPWFQDLVDKAPAGSVLKPPAGTYAGPVVVDMMVDREECVFPMVPAGGANKDMILERPGKEAKARAAKSQTGF